MVEDDLIQLFPLNRVVPRTRRCNSIWPVIRAFHCGHWTRFMLRRVICTTGGTMSATDGRIRAACQQFAIALVPSNLEDLNTNN